MTLPRDQQSEFKTLLSDVHVLLTGWHSDGTAWSAWDESVRQRVYDMQHELERPDLTAHDEALPGDWTTDGTQNGWWEIYCGETWLASIQGEISAKAVTAAHNSALRALKEAGNG